jgi:hypothetical protein
VCRWGLTLWQVNLNSNYAHISDLIAIPAPDLQPDSPRISPTEFQTVTLNCTLVKFKSEADEDYHLVLQDTSGNTMIAEIPNPSCLHTTSPFYALVSKARSDFDNQYDVSGSFQTVNVPVQITGVCFFDFLHGQSGVAPNGMYWQTCMYAFLHVCRYSKCFSLTCAGLCFRIFVHDTHPWTGIELHAVLHITFLGDASQFPAVVTPDMMYDWDSMESALQN